MPDEWLLLGQLFDAARRRATVQARRLATALLDDAVDDAIQAIAAAYLEGARTSFTAYASDLRLGRSVPRELATVWTSSSIALGARLVERLRTTVNARGEVTKLFIESYADTTVQQSLWRGVDQTGQELGTLAEVEWKTWVRAWPRKEHRDWHTMLEGVTIPVDDAFRLPGGPNAGTSVYGPRAWDSVSDPGEHLNCGHALRFSKRASRSDLAKTMERRELVYAPPTGGPIRAAQP